MSVVSARDVSTPFLGAFSPTKPFLETPHLHNVRLLSEISTSLLVSGYALSLTPNAPGQTGLNGGTGLDDF